MKKWYLCLCENLDMIFVAIVNNNITESKC